MQLNIGGHLDHRTLVQHLREHPQDTLVLSSELGLPWIESFSWHIKFDRELGARVILVVSEEHGDYSKLKFLGGRCGMNLAPTMPHVDHTVSSLLQLQELVTQPSERGPQPEPAVTEEMADDEPAAEEADDTPEG